VKGRFKLEITQKRKVPEGLLITYSVSNINEGAEQADKVFKSYNIG